MQGKEQNIQRGQRTINPEKLRISDVAVMRDSGPRGFFGWREQETALDWFPASSGDEEMYPSELAELTMDGMIYNIQVNVASSEANRLFQRHSTSRGLVQALMYDHLSFNSPRPKAVTKQPRPRSLLTAMVALHNINSAVSQIEEKQNGLKQEESGDEPTEPP